MLKTIFSFIAFLVFSISLMSQSQFENAGFEEWEEIGLGPDVLEPVNWSSIKTTADDQINANAPINFGRSDDAHTGNYSIYLYNFPVFNIIATGTITNGRVHGDYDPELGYVYTNEEDDKWHTKFTDRPDSVVGWYKSNVQPGDFPAVRFVLHTGYASIPPVDELNIVAEAKMDLSETSITEWTRFSVPFEYIKDINPEYVLATIYSGNGTEAVANSEAWYDDLEMIYNPEAIDELTAEDFQVSYSNGNLKLNLQAFHQDDLELQLTDMMGHVVYSNKTETGNTQNISIDLTTGVYVVSILRSYDRISKKIVVR